MVAVSQATVLMLVGGSDGHRGIGIRLPGSRICKECDIVDHARLIANAASRPTNANATMPVDAANKH